MQNFFLNIFKTTDFQLKKQRKLVVYAGAIKISENILFEQIKNNWFKNAIFSTSINLNNSK